MRTISIFVISITMASIIGVSCNSSKEGVKTSTNEVKIITSTQTIIVSGASKMKGRRISLSLIIDENITLDSIQFESFFQPVNIIKTSNDTVFMDANFYPIRSATNLNSSTGSLDNEFKSNQCTLFYRTDKKSKSMVITDLKMVTDPTKWE